VTSIISKNKIPKTLVTTALEETWPKDDSYIHFLGEWCLSFNQRHKWQKREHSLEPYHWDDRNKLYDDFHRLTEIYESALVSVAARLNELHKVNHSVRFWRILVGPWLHYFCEILFDRWSMLHQALTTGEFLPVRVIRRSPCELVANDFNEFLKLVESDEWNEHIFTQVLVEIGYPIHEIDSTSITAKTDGKRMKQNPRGFRRRIRGGLGLLASSISKYMGANDRYFLLSTCFSKVDEAIAYLYLSQLPRFWRSKALPRFEHSTKARDVKLAITKQCVHEELLVFHQIVQSLTMKNLPLAYLEGFSELMQIVDSVGWPRKPYSIYTSNAYSYDDLFKAWSACRVEQGSRLIIGQHGGGYGSTKFQSDEDHQIAIADTFLSWGWDDPQRDKIKPFGIQTNCHPTHRHIKSKQNGDVLIAGLSLPRYSFRMFSSPIGAGQYIRYIDDLISILENLPAEIRKKCILRFNLPNNYDQQEESRITSRITDVNIENMHEPLFSRITRSRICISTYNSTVLLQTLGADFPTIAYWNPSQSELRESVKSLYADLEQVRILHTSPESAATHLAEIWENIDEWWYDSNTISSRRIFCESLALRKENCVRQFAKIIN